MEKLVNFEDNIVHVYQKKEDQKQLLGENKIRFLKMTTLFLNVQNFS